MTHTVVGIFDEIGDAREAMNELVEKGFVKEDVDISQGRVSDKTAAAVADDDNTDIGDSISNFFNYLFGDDDARAQSYTDIARRANAVLTVQADSSERAEEASDILDNHNAIDVGRRAAQYKQAAATDGRNEDDARVEGKETIPVVEENIEVGKKTVETGGVRIRSQIVEKPIEESVRLREEHVIVDRHPVNREVTDADIDNLREGEIEITERAEKAVVGKQARVVEEIEVGKEVSEREETIRDTVRKTDVDVEEVDTKSDIGRARGQ